MRRREFILTLGAALALGQAAEAKDYARRVIRDLEKAGYRVVSVTRTFLGRTRIKAVRGRDEREIVLNAATGEILRDLLIVASGGRDGGSGSGGSGSDDDDDDDHDDDDHSGPGGGGDDDGGGDDGGGGSDDD
ncbi:MAG: hypothetical protein R3D63_04895 [Paracoccaceae bacterium]